SLFIAFPNDRSVPSRQRDRKSLAASHHDVQHAISVDVGERYTLRVVTAGSIPEDFAVGCVNSHDATTFGNHNHLRNAVGIEIRRAQGSAWCVIFDRDSSKGAQIVRA